MCGRFARTSGRDELAKEFGVTRFVNIDLHARYNIAPSQPVEAVIRDGTERRMGPMRWGFAAADRKVAPINARAETVATAPLFRSAFRGRRCLVVADGFYEWRKDGRVRRPSFIRLRSGRPFGFAALWSFDPASTATSRVATCAIVTCPPN